MMIKKFQGNTETEAIMLAKEELGKDAIVMNIKTIKPRGLYKLFRKVSVEVTAALDDNTNSFEKDSQGRFELASEKDKEPKKNLLKQNKNILIEETEEDSEEKNQGYSSKTSAIEEKLNSLQSILEQQMKVHKTDEELTNTQEEDKNTACLKLIYNQLVENEVDKVYAKQIIHEIKKNITKDTSVDNILSAVYQKIVLKLGQPQKVEPTSGKVKFVYFIGPTGVGKTTTIAKIASTFQLEQKKKVALITSDTYRIAAVEQLRTYANILGIPVKVVYEKNEITEAKDEFLDYDLVLVDTAGRSHRNKEQRDDLESLLNGIDAEDKEVYLVLSATTKYSDLIKIVDSYKDITPFRIIFTKIDETGCVGNILNLRMLTNAPLSYATWGQNVPDDIGLINPQKIAKQLLGGK